MIRTTFKRNVMTNPYPKPRGNRQYDKESLLHILRKDVHTWNTQWTNRVIRNLSVVQLLCQAYPTYREEYCYWAFALGMIQGKI